MSTTATLPIVSASAPSAFRVFLTEIRYEVLRALRTRAFSLSAVGFPIMFYCLFGLMMNRNQTIGAVDVTKYLLGGYSIFGSLGAAIFGIGVGVALDRSAGWLELKQASPMPPLAYVLSKGCMAVAFSLIIVSILTILGIAFGHVHITLSEYLRIMGIAALAAVPFSCLGLALAFLVPPTAAGGIANLVYLPMSFLSGLWVPLKFLPHALQVIAPVFPTYHLAQMMYATLGAPSEGTFMTHILGLLGFTLIMLGITWLAYQRRADNA
ncbi:ABC transporter permease [Terriglobus roseus]|uniref:Transport permease protein n=1 Tax=Terriglobus roseus TaxID=392734 RepID=A0A1G7KMF0_9BACT|nr:ABC transporter permease [Terriglobus roseus]SDF38301.1 ABC-2 type transport system permease protein [Terriglobus roseus]